MNNMKVNVLLIATFLGMLILSSCNEDEAPVPKDDSWYWGYFEGEINGDIISLKNKDYNGPVKTGRRGIFNISEWNVIPDSVNIMGTLINYNDSSELRITLYDLTPSERYLTLSINEHFDENWISATVFSSSSKNEIESYYVPSKENPFRVEIADVLWVSQREPIIEVKLDGVLYNKENHKDAIVIKGVYGTR